jgi:hypothetical protein
MEQALSAPRALQCLAAYVRQHSDLFVRSGPNVLKPEESASRRRQIETLATARPPDLRALMRVRVANQHILDLGRRGRKIP